MVALLSHHYYITVSLTLYKELLTSSQGMYLSMLHLHFCSYTDLSVGASAGTTSPFLLKGLSLPHPRSTAIKYWSTYFRQYTTTVSIFILFGVIFVCLFLTVAPSLGNSHYLAYWRLQGYSVLIEEIQIAYEEARSRDRRQVEDCQGFET